MKYIINTLSISCLLLALIYYSDMLIRTYYSLDFEMRLKSFEKEAKSIKDKNLQEKIAVLYFPQIDALRGKFLSGYSYWKNIYQSYHLVALSYLYERKPIMAIHAINQGLNLHPFYPNSYHLLSLIFGNTPYLFAPEKAQKCGQIYTSLMAGNKISLEDVCQCINIRLCHN